jgi:hypothetical protein
MAESEERSHAKDLSISLLAANLYSLAFSLPLLAVLFGIYLGLSPRESPVKAHLTVVSGVVFLGLFLLGIIVHEVVHGVAWALFGRLPLKRIRFGLAVSTLTPYAHALDPLPAGAYRLGALLPAILLGVVPFAVGTALGSLALALYGMVFVFAAGGDLLVLWLIRKVGRNVRVQDHPTRAGCIVLEDDGR